MDPFPLVPPHVQISADPADFPESQASFSTVPARSPLYTGCSLPETLLLLRSHLFISFPHLLCCAHNRYSISIIPSSISNTSYMMKRNFLRCGMAGWCMEILWTGLHSFRVRDPKLTGHSSLWMFPIYGCCRLSGTADAAGLSPPFLETRSYLYAVHLSGGIYQRYSTSVQERMSLEL